MIYEQNIKRHPQEIATNLLFLSRYIKEQEKALATIGTPEDLQKRKELLHFSKQEEEKLLQETEARSAIASLMYLMQQHKKQDFQNPHLAILENKEDPTVVRAMINLEKTILQEPSSLGLLGKSGKAYFEAFHHDVLYTKNNHLTDINYKFRLDQVELFLGLVKDKTTEGKISPSTAERLMTDFTTIYQDLEELKKPQLRVSEETCRLLATRFTMAYEREKAKQLKETKEKQNKNDFLSQLGIQDISSRLVKEEAINHMRMGLLYSYSGESIHSLLETSDDVWTQKKEEEATVKGLYLESILTLATPSEINVIEYGYNNGVFGYVAFDNCHSQHIVEQVFKTVKDKSLAHHIHKRLHK